MWPLEGDVVILSYLRRTVSVSLNKSIHGVSVHYCVIPTWSLIIDENDDTPGTPGWQKEL